MFIGASNELGAFESGVAAKLFGAVPSVVAGGILTLGVVGAGRGAVPALRRLDLDTAAPPPDDDAASRWSRASDAARGKTGMTDRSRKGSRDG